MAETIADGENLRVVRYSNDAEHVYNVDPVTGKQAHTSHDQVLIDRGFDPADSAANAALRPPENSGLSPEVDSNSELMALMRQMEENNQRRHDELLAVLQALVQQGNGNNAGNNQNHDPNAPTDPNQPGNVVPNPTDDTPEGRQQAHFNQITGDEDDDNNGDDDNGDGNENGNNQEQIDPTPQERLAQATEALGRSRDDLARYTILRRARSWDRFGGRRRQDAEAYRAALGEYLQHYQDFLEATRDIARAEGVPEEDIVDARIAPAEYSEQRLFAQRVGDIDQDLYNESQRAGGFRAFRERAIKHWAGYSKKKKFLIGAAVGLGAALASSTLGLGIAGLAVGSAARYSVAILNRVSSARNNSPESVRNEIMNITRQEQRDNNDRRHSRLLRLDRQNPDEYVATSAIDRNLGYHEGTLRSARRRNRIGLGIMLASGALAGYGIAELAGAPHLIPSIHDALTHNGPKGPDWKTFHPDSFKGPNGNAAVWHAVDVLKRNHIDVQGLTPDKVHAISQDLANRHFEFASGMGQHGQNVVEWTTRQVPNAHASDLEGMVKVNGSSVGGWQEFVKVLNQHNVATTQR